MAFPTPPTAIPIGGSSTVVSRPRRRLPGRLRVRSRALVALVVAACATAVVAAPGGGNAASLAPAILAPEPPAPPRVTTARAILLSPFAATTAWSAQASQPDVRLGAAVAGAGDVNGDGFADLLVGAPGFTGTLRAQGLALLFLGGPDGLSREPAWSLLGDAELARTGAAVAAAGDVNADGYADVMIAAPGWNEGALPLGKVSLFLGGPQGLQKTAQWTAYGDEEGAGFGTAAAGVGDLDGDGYGDVLVAAPGHDAEKVDAGRVYVFSGGAAGLAATASSSLDGDAPGAQLGASLAAAHDVDGDGRDDIVIGAPGYPHDGHLGRAYVYSGGSRRLGEARLLATIASTEPLSKLGYAVAGLGDVNADGYADIAVGEPEYRYIGQLAGRVLLYLGAPGGLSATPAWTAHSHSQKHAGFGAALAAAGDVNGDGYADLVVGAREYDNRNTDEGRLCLYLGSAAGFATNPEWMADGGRPLAYLGHAIAGVGDTDADGLDDVAVGAPGMNATKRGAGAVYLLRGAATELSHEPSFVLDGPPLPHPGAPAISGTSDLDGDGYAEIAVGSSPPPEDSEDSGVVYVYAAGTAGFDPRPRWIISGPRADERFGVAVHAGADLDGDGRDDLAVGAPRREGRANPGRVYVFPGSALGPGTAPLEIRDDESAGSFGSSLATGDYNCDGRADLAVSAPEDDSAGAKPGSATVFWGSLGEEAPARYWRHVGPEPGEHFAAAMAGPADFNGDGCSDLAVSAPAAQGQPVGSGRIYIFAGSAAGLPARASLVLSGPDRWARFGAFVAATDTNGDGFDDLLAVAPEAVAAGPGPGYAAVYFGSPSGLAGAPAWRAPDDLMPAGVVAVAALGDANGDGTAELVVAGTDQTGNETAFVLWGRPQGPAETWQPLAIAKWPSASVPLSSHVSLAAGDVNADGFADLLVATKPPWTPDSPSRLSVYAGNRGGKRFAPSAPSADCTSADVAATAPCRRRTRVVQKPRTRIEE
ncbi:MAG: FG-GAP repeat protein [Candidatus Schekmanbacteria bacterium]|nr:FG-GAP repeat protein [Candidatus Schekmanbacteria bacterium]